MRGFTERFDSGRIRHNFYVMRAFGERLFEVWSYRRRLARFLEYRNGFGRTVNRAGIMKSIARVHRQQIGRTGQGESEQLDSSSKVVLTAFLPRKAYMGDKSQKATSYPRIAVRISAFLVCCAVLVAALSLLFEPFTVGTTNNDTVKGVYAQPSDTIEVAVFGTSTPHAAISPMEMYERRGIVAYNCATSNQSMLSAYYLLKDMLRSQGGSLRVVVVDPSSIVTKNSEKRKRSFTEKAIRGMDFSPVKIEAIFAAWKEYSGYGLVSHLLPILSYHERWSELSRGDFAFLLGAQGDYSSHGQYIRYTSNANGESTPNMRSEANEGITYEKSYSDEDLQDAWNMDEKAYLDKIEDLCRSRGIEMVFIQTPRLDWGDLQHDSIQLLADSYGIPFIDYSPTEFMKELGLRYVTDFVDEKHPNAHGARKISCHLGDYLADSFGLTDVREDESFAFMHGDSIRYDEAMEDAALLLCSDLDEYLDRISRDRYTVFIAANGDIKSMLDESSLAKLEAMGLSNLAGIGQDLPYAGLIDGGVVFADSVSANSNNDSVVSGTYANYVVTMEKTNLQPNAVLGNSFTILSGGSKSGPSCSILINGSEKSENRSGLNFVIYDKVSEELVDTSSFDVGGRTSDLYPEA